MQHIKCKDCCGTGQVESSIYGQYANCSSCKGTGTIATEIKNICSCCNGTGWINGPAYWCRDMICDKCNGSGLKP